MRRKDLPALLLLLGACARPLATPPAPEPRSLEVAAPVDSVIRAAATLLISMDWVVRSHDPAGGMLSAERHAMYDRNAEWIECAGGYIWTGAPGVRLPRSTVGVEVQASPGDAATRVRITARVVRAEAYDALLRRLERVRCVSSGAVERALGDSLLARFHGRPRRNT